MGHLTYDIRDHKSIESLLVIVPVAGRDLLLSF